MAQESMSVHRCSQPSLECWSAVTLSNRDPVLHAGGVGSGKAAVFLHDHMKDSAYGDTTDKRQRTQMKAMTTATGSGKTVAVYGTEPNKVEVCSAGRSAVQVDLLQCATQSRGEAQGKAQLSAGLKMIKDMGTLYVPGGIQQNAGRAVLGVTKEIRIPCSLVTETGTVGLPRETSQEPTVLKRGVYQVSCRASLVGKGSLTIATAISKGHDDLLKIEKCVSGNVIFENNIGDMFTKKDGSRMSSVTTRGRAAGLSMETSRDLPVLELEVVQDRSGTTLGEQGGTAPHNESVWGQTTRLVCDQFGEKCIHTVKASSVKQDVLVAPPEQSGQNGVLHPVVCDEASSQCDISETVLVQCDAYRDDKCTVLGNESQVPLVPLGTGGAALQNACQGSTTDWDSWAKQLLAMLDKSRLGNTDVDITPAMPNGGTTGWPVTKGTLAHAEIDPLQSEGPVKGACMAVVLSAAQPLENSECKNGNVTYDLQRLPDAVTEGINVICTSDGTPVEHQAVKTDTVSEVEVAINVSTFPASVDEPLHVIDDGKVPRRVLYVDVGRIKLTNVLLKMLEVQKGNLLYTWVSPLWSDEVVLRSTTRWSQVVQAMFDVIHKRNWLVPYLLAVWQMVSRFSERVLPVTGLDGRRSGERLKISEVSPPDAVTGEISADAVQSAAERWLVEGTDTASPTRLHMKEGTEMDVAIAEIFPVSRTKIQIKVPGYTVGEADEGIGFCSKVMHTPVGIVAVRNDLGLGQCNLLGQPPMERWTACEAELGDHSVEHSHLPMCGLSSGWVLTNYEKSSDGIGSWDLIIGDLLMVGTANEGLIAMGNLRQVVKPKKPVVMGKSGVTERKGGSPSGKVLGTGSLYQGSEGIRKDSVPLRKANKPRNPRRGRRRRIEKSGIPWRVRVGLTWKRTRKKGWTYAADSRHRGVPTLMTCAGVPPPSGSKQRGGICNSQGPGHHKNAAKTDTESACQWTAELHSITLKRRKLFWQLSPGFAKFEWGCVVWRSCRDLGGMGSPALCPGLGNSQQVGCSGENSQYNQVLVRTEWRGRWSVCSWLLLQGRPVCGELSVYPARLHPLCGGDFVPMD